MDDAVRLKCPSCGDERITWVAAGQATATCPVCGASVPVQRVEPPPAAADGAAGEASPYAQPAASVPMPAKLDVSLPPESKAPVAPSYYGYGPPPMPPPYGMPMVPVHIPVPRNVQPVVICLALLTVVEAGFGIYGALSSPSSQNLASGGLITLLLILLVVVGVAITYFVLLLVWVYRVHQDLEALTAGSHSPTPGLAMGLLFVPVMHPFWLWYVMRRLSERVSGADETGSTGGIGRAPLTIFLAASILALVAMPFQVAFSLHMQSSGEVPPAVVPFNMALVCVEIIGLVCLAVAMTSIGNAAAYYTGKTSSQLAPPVAPPTYPGQPYGKPY